MKPKDGLMYIVFQLIGAVIGGAILYFWSMTVLSGSQRSIRQVY